MNTENRSSLATSSPGALPTEWALSFEAVVLAQMIAVAAGQGRLRSLLFSKESLIYFGSIAMLTSGFFRYSSGSLFDVSLYLILTYCLPAFDVPTLLAVWPMAYAMIAMSVSYLTIMTGRKRIPLSVDDSRHISWRGSRRRAGGRFLVRCETPASTGLDGVCRLAFARSGIACSHDPTRSRPPPKSLSG